jgi:uncharacterized protein (TIGR02996 family)
VTRFPSHPELLTAVLEHPDDETPRLIAADWLDEQGHTIWATFIRTQIEMTNLLKQKNADSDHYADLVKTMVNFGSEEMHDIFRSMGVEIVPATMDIFSDEVIVQSRIEKSQIRFHRGWIRSVICRPSPRLLTMVEHLLATQPIRELRYGDGGWDWKPVPGGKWNVTTLSPYAERTGEIHQSFDTRATAMKSIMDRILAL